MNPSLQPALPSGTHAGMYDLFNGDADGICALHQLRMLAPRNSYLLTGTKRDIALLEKLPSGMSLDVTVLDLSFDRNEVGVRQVLQSGGRVLYFDHHAAHKLFSHPQLECHIDQSMDVCTSLLVDRHLGGLFRHWTIVAAYGDNLPALADSLAQASACTAAVRTALAQLGNLLNYNAYGETTSDLFFHPAQLYQSVHRFESPLDFIAKAHEYQCLAEGHAADLRCLHELKPHAQNALAAVYVLPDKAWARRISGTLANRLVTQSLGQSVAVLTPRTDGNFLVSVRVTPTIEARADSFCSRYQGGGGRYAAGGIDRLPASELDRFITAFFHHLTGHSR